MIEYPHIDSVFKRDGRGKFIIGEYSQPEFEYLKDLPWSWTEKIDGTNIRVMYTLEEGNASGIRKVIFGGKTSKAQLNAKFVTILEETFPLELMQEEFGETDVCLYGEGFGKGIQKVGELYSSTQKFILFDIRVGRWWLKRDSVEEIAARLNIPVVPKLETGNISLEYMVRDVAAFTDNPPHSNIGTATIEGWVGIPAVPLLSRSGQRVITKVKYRDFS